MSQILCLPGETCVAPSGIPAGRKNGFARPTLPSLAFYDAGRRGKVGLSGPALAGGRPLLRRGSAGPPVGEELGGAVDRKGLGIVALPEARVRLAVRDVRPETARLNDHRLSAH